MNKIEQTETELFQKELDNLQRLQGDRIEASKFELLTGTKEYALQEAQEVAVELSKCSQIKAIGLFGSTVSEDRDYPKDLDLVIFVDSDVADYYQRFKYIGTSDNQLMVEENLPPSLIEIRDAIQNARAVTTKSGLSERPMDIILLPYVMDEIDVTTIGHFYSKFELFGYIEDGINNASKLLSLLHTGMICKPIVKDESISLNILNNPYHPNYYVGFFERVLQFKGIDKKIKVTANGKKCTYTVI